MAILLTIIHAQSVLKQKNNYMAQEEMLLLG